MKGELSLESGRITFTATQRIPRVGKRTAAKLEEVSGRQGVASALLEGRPQTVLEIPVSEIESWKVKSLGSQLHLKTPGRSRQYIFTFYDAEKAIRSQVSSLRGVGRANEWKQALTEATEEVS